MCKTRPPQIGLTGHIIVPTENLERVTSALPEHIRLTRAESGCVLFEVTQNPENPNRFDVREQYVDQSAFEYHQTRLANSVWARMTQNVTRHYKKFEITP